MHFFCCFYGYGDHRDLHVLTHSFPTRRSSDLSVMNDQPMIDGYHHSDLRHTRSAMQSIIPVATGLAQGVERLLPQLAGKVQAKAIRVPRSEEHTSELQSLMRISYAVFCLKKKNNINKHD